MIQKTMYASLDAQQAALVTTIASLPLQRHREIIRDIQRRGAA